MPSGFNLRQKDISVGSGLNIEYSQTGAGILISAVDTTNTTVHIYDATVEAETGVITITDGTQVADLAIGDEIRTPDGVYQKIKDSITTGSPADGTRIEVSGITSPAEANGLYILTETANVWKHESADYWISSWNNAYYWMISAVEDAANPGSSLFYGHTTTSSMPWEVTSWTSPSGAAGTPVVENAPVEQVITNTIDLFEYASLPVEPENIVQSVNGTKPDASGNVTIETSSGGLTSVSVGNGLTGNGTSSSPIKLDLSTAVMEHNCNINAQGNRFNVENLNTASIQTTDIELAVSSEFYLYFPGYNIDITINPDGIDIQTTSIKLNRCRQNTAGGFAIVGEDGKLPSSIIPVSGNRHPFTSSDLSSNVLTITTTGNVTGVIDDSGKAWNFADEEVTYTDSTVSVDLSGVFARKGIATPTGTWKLMLYGA